MKIIPVYNTIILPDVQYHLLLDILSEEEKSSLKEEETVLLLPLKEVKQRDEIEAEDFYDLGVLARIQEVKEIEEGIIFKIETIKKVKTENLIVTENYIEADYEILEEKSDITPEGEQELFEFIKKTATEIALYFPQGERVLEHMQRWSTLNEWISVLGQYTGLSVPEKYALLKTDSVKERGTMISDNLIKLKATLDLQADLKKRYQDTQGSAYKEAAIHKQIELLQQELDSMNPEEKSEEDRFEEKIEQAGMSEDVKKEVSRVLKRFKQESPSGHEYSSLYDYLDFVTGLSWKNDGVQKIDLSKARKVLNEQHYGLNKIKDRILQHLAVMSLKEEQTGSILLLVGAPGTGKTSMGKSIAEALGREYVRISLGGVRDEAEIRGHRRTYVGAMPGRIMDGIRRAGVMNPVMVLDEIDKLSSGYNGDPASALLEVLDPEQNNTFTDHYMNVPYDLSNVLFICTANTLETVPRPLLDRMEILELSGYTPIEKFHIAKEHLLPRAIKDAGIDSSRLFLTDKVIEKIISEYTMEAGVRGLKKQLDKLCRQAAVKMVEEDFGNVVVTEEELPVMLGKKASRHDRILHNHIPGIATGLAWTQAGGEILFIETTAMNGTGKINITGQLGDVMKESAAISASLVKSIFVNEKLDFHDKDLHIHVPSGAVPKDGPSAGITLTTALVSLVTGIPVNPELAMTGEISLRGQVLPIGGLPEKLMAAERAGVKKVLIPYENREDLDEVPEEIKNKLEIVPVDTIEDVLTEALNIHLPVKEKQPLLMIPQYNEAV